MCVCIYYNISLYKYYAIVVCTRLHDYVCNHALLCVLNAAKCR